MIPYVKLTEVTIRNVDLHINPDNIEMLKPVFGELLAPVLDMIKISGEQILHAYFNPDTEDRCLESEAAENLKILVDKIIDRFLKKPTGDYSNMASEVKYFLSYDIDTEYYSLIYRVSILPNTMDVKYVHMDEGWTTTLHRKLLDMIHSVKDVTFEQIDAIITAFISLNGLSDKFIIELTDMSKTTIILRVCEKGEPYEYQHESDT